MSPLPRADSLKSLFMSTGLLEKMSYIDEYVLKFLVECLISFVTSETSYEPRDESVRERVENKR